MATIILILVIMLIRNIVNIPLWKITMNVGKVHLKAFLSLQWNSVNMLNLTIRIKKILEIIEQEHKVHPVYQVHQGERALTGATGPEGIQGKQGIQGIQGETGPAGINQLNANNSYAEVSGPFFTNDETGDRSDNVTCDLGDSVISGGYATIFPVNIDFSLLLNQPILTPLGAGWEVEISENSFSRHRVNFNVGAICFDNPPTHIP